jgi:hypothetical protein
MYKITGVNIEKKKLWFLILRGFFCLKKKKNLPERLSHPFGPYGGGRTTPKNGLGHPLGQNGVASHPHVTQMDG